MNTRREVPGYEISTDRSRLDLDLVHSFLVRSYWSAGVPRAVVARSLEHSICFGVYKATAQVGLARVITDRASFAYLADVFILEEHRGRGLSKWLMECVVGHPELQGLRRFMLLTSDAHGLYRQFVFTELADPRRVMEIARPDIYRAAPEGGPGR